jgi:small subunit ribosomal protein S8
LKYGPEGESPILNLERVSRPGRRIYVGAKEIPRVLGGLGIAILSTPKGIMTGRDARRQNVGGEVLCYIY